MSLSSKLGPRLRIVAVVDPATERANAVLASKRVDTSPSIISAYQNTKTFSSLDDFVKYVSENEHDRPNAVVIGAPPMFRGGVKEGKDIELQVLKHFAGVPLFVEKPVATGPVEEVKDTFTVAKAIKESGIVCGVGYVVLHIFHNGKY